LGRASLGGLMLGSKTGTTLSSFPIPPPFLKGIKMSYHCKKCQAVTKANCRHVTRCKAKVPIPGMYNEFNQCKLYAVKDGYCKTHQKKKCEHKNIHNEDWPDGGIEICNDCGMSRSIWEQGASDWFMIKDIPKARIELQEYIENLPENIEAREEGK
jgi:hypothetical protein